MLDIVPANGSDAPMTDDEFERALDEHRLRSDEPDAGSWGWSPGRIVSVALLLAMAGFWVWAFSPWAPRGHPDELDDPAFAGDAERRCSRALERIDAEIPLALEATSGDERADFIDAGTAILRDMVIDLAALAPDPTTRDGDLVRRWLADWDIYLGDRDAYASDFRAGIDAPLSVTVVRGGQVTDPIDSFANANDMPSCASPTDV